MGSEARREGERLMAVRGQWVDGRDDVDEGWSGDA